MVLPNSLSAAELISAATQVIYVLIFFRVLVSAVRRPTTAHIDIALFFGSIAFIVFASLLPKLGQPIPPRVLLITLVSLLMALPYVLLRLVDDFTVVPWPIKRAAETGLVLSIVAAVVLDPLPPAVGLSLTVYFAALSIYCATQFTRAGRRSKGITRRRMQVISYGTLFLGLNIAVAGAAAFLPATLRGAAATTGQLLGLASGVLFYLGFATPRILQNAWQEPALRAFLSQAARLPRYPTTLDIVRELEAGASAIAGCRARIGLWQEEIGKIRMWDDKDQVHDVALEQYFGGKAFVSQRVMTSDNPGRENPNAADRYRARRVGAAIAAPITAGQQRLGVLSLYAERPPIFADGYVELVRLLADQAAVVLESRILIDQAALVHAREETTRLKDDFLSAAAHDLRTPLTTVIAQAELLERRAVRDPGSPPDLGGLQRIVRESKRLAALVGDLLDAGRLERGRLVGEREPVDLGALVAEVAARTGSELSAEQDEPIVGHYDRRRIEQLLDNLLENAHKYAVNGDPVVVKLSRREREARIDVSDHGIGIPAEDIKHIFDRYARGSNVDDRHFHGMGLGLYICRGIVQEHGGRIWAESELGKGSTFSVALPIAAGGTAPT